MRMRTVLTVLVAMLVVGSACASGGSEADDQTTVGISKIVSHPALDGTEQGIQDELAELGYADIVFDLQNANGDYTTAVSIANKFKADNVDVAVGIATPTAQALVESLDDIPVVFTAVTDPVDSGLMPSYDGGGGNVTGYSDMTPVREQIELLYEFMPISAIGHVYSSGEANAVSLATQAREVCADLGIEFVESTVANSAEVRQATQSIVDRVDLIYVSTDNTVVSALNSLVDAATDNGVPVMSADPTSAEELGVIAAYGFDYYTMGRATGALIARILEGEDPDSIAVQYLTDAEDLILHLNLDVAENLGIDLPQELIDRADRLVRDGELVEQ